MSYFKWQKLDVHLDCPSISMKRPIYLKMPEVEIIIGACQNQLERTIVVMLFDTAVRISELLNIKLDDIDWDIKAITVVRKGGRITEVNVSDRALIELKKWLYIRKGDSKRVFLDMSYGDAWRMVKDIGKRTNIGTGIHPHIFRHSRAVQMLRDGVPLNVVSQHLGHKHINTTADIYGQFITPDLREMIPPW
jgi:integrase/recombinase XerD